MAQYDTAMYDADISLYDFEFALLGGGIRDGERKVGKFRAGKDEQD